MRPTLFRMPPVASLVVGLICTLGLVNSAVADPVKGEPLAKSDIETAQGIPLATLGLDGKVAMNTIHLHWSPTEEANFLDDSISFTLDLHSDAPGAGIFTAQLWNASLASAMAWQEPWLSAHWQVSGTPQCDGSGIEAGLAVGMITTSARRKFPDGTAVIASLNPDGSLGPVTQILERLKVLSENHMKAVVISNLQQFETGPDGQVVNVAREAELLGLQCIPAESLVEATEKTMSDPLPPQDIPDKAAQYNSSVGLFLEQNTSREQDAVTSLIHFAPKDEELSHYPPFLASKWKDIRDNYEAGKEAYRAGELYVAYRNFAAADAELGATNSAALNDKDDFDVKGSIAAADDLRKTMDNLLVHPVIDQQDLRSALVVAEMADWVRDVEQPLEGAEMLVKQAYSQRTDATPDQQNLARERLLFALEEAKNRLRETIFFSGVAARIEGERIPAEGRADEFYGQLLPAELATAQLFTEQVKDTVTQTGSDLLFDYRLASYVQSVRQTKALWEARLRQKEIEAAQKQAEQAALENPVATQTATVTAVSFDPGSTYAPPRSTVFSSAPEAMSKESLCMCWANDKCEIAMLSQKYLSLKGSVDPQTLEWHVEDRPKLEQMLTTAEKNARLGIAMATKSNLDISVLSMIYEEAQAYRIRRDDSSGLEALRDYWRVCLLGNLCWQLSFTPKAKAVDLGPQVVPTQAQVAPTPGKTKKPSPVPQKTPAPVPTLDLNNIPVARAVTDTPSLAPAATSTPSTTTTPFLNTPPPTEVTPTPVPVAPAAREDQANNSNGPPVKALPVDLPTPQ